MKTPLVKSRQLSRVQEPSTSPLPSRRLPRRLLDGPLAPADSDLLNNLRNDMRELKKRWDNRLVEPFNVVERYVQFGLAILLHIRICGHSYLAHITALLGGQDDTLNSSSSFRLQVDCPNRGSVYWDERMVFVDNIESVKSIKGIIPSIVRLYRLEKKGLPTAGESLYRSRFDGLYYFLPQFPKGEIGLAGGSSPEPLNHLVNKQGQGSPQIMHDISDDGRNLINRLFARKGFVTDVQLPRLTIEIQLRSVTPTLTKRPEHAIKLRNVLVGPFDL